MKELISYIIAMSISGLIFINISIKLKWSEKLWSFFNKKIKLDFNVAIWILISALIQGFLADVIGTISISSKIILGLTMGFFFAFMPNLGKK
ncbi:MULTISPECIES: hypothetical protein [Clostridium]|uniref:hypothetical protein n=1 Tax=Clostridium TaxID=1485 RepID=UPI0006B29E04|nr:hypothetical protein [Clostridium sporogenes]STC80501.1 Uncharacterised protein [Clostridium botulinum]KOY67330.1 hypothetical protein AN649_02785 [Clostridium sporogenes]MCW6086889.1 hypothetical protein [Clostridium sporogenes]MDS1008767.1 hypothetical protein [Clostridium sporogenes]NFD95103.1 hypothetical protein [Clostridium sporogenes]